MPISHYIDFVEGVVKITFTGKISGSDLYEGLSALFEDKHWRGDFPHLWDGSQIRVLDIDFHELLMIHSMIDRVMEKGKLITAKSAVVVSNRMVYIFARSMYSFYGWYKPFKIFNDARSAEAWMYLPQSEHFSTLKDDERTQVSEPCHI